MCSDTQLRDVLDTIDPKFIRDEFSVKFGQLKKAGILKDFRYKLGSTFYHIVSCDGVHHFSSKHIHCDCCLEKKHKDGSITYQHQMLCAALVHPDRRETFLMDVEPIVKQDGSTKQDCELNAGKRLQMALYNKYSTKEKRYNFLIVEDALYANIPHINLLTSNGFNFLINVKPKKHKTLFAYVQGKRARKKCLPKSTKRISPRNQNGKTL